MILIDGLRTLILIKLYIATKILINIMIIVLLMTIILMSEVNYCTTDSCGNLGEDWSCNDPSSVMSNYSKYNSNQLSYQEIAREELDNGISQIIYDLFDNNGILKNKLFLTIPKYYNKDVALFGITGGSIKIEDGEAKYFPPKGLTDHLKISLESNRVSAFVTNIPAQPQDGLVEDWLLADSFKKFLADPKKNCHSIALLQMVDTVRQSMNIIQKITDVQEFVLYGQSKRGWTAWLTGEIDPRVRGIIPIVADTVNIPKVVKLACESTGCLALEPYKKANVISCVDGSDQSENCKILIEIADPINYMQDKSSKPRFIINVSNDEFFYPESANLYFGSLSGEKNYINTIPHGNHHFAGNPISDKLSHKAKLDELLSQYFGFIIDNTELPKIYWAFNKNKELSINSSIAPQNVTLWYSNNSKNDWGLINNPSNISMDNIPDDKWYKSTEINFDCIEKSDCKIKIDLSKYIKQNHHNAIYSILSYKIGEKIFETGTTVKVFHR